MLIGAHGIGKSTVVKAIVDQIGSRFKYYSSSTLDPYAELIGIPVPDRERGTVDFYRPQDLESAEFIFFDELNRAHPRVLNTVLEIIQFKSINGVPLKNLKMVWAAINPPGDDYQVEELDPALVDRFHVYIKMQPTIYLPYMRTVMDPEIASALRDWWNDDLSDEQRRILTPRRIEYIGTLIDKNIPFRDAIPQGHGKFPVPNLEKRIRQIKGEESDLVINRDTILENPDKFVDLIKQDKSLAIEASKYLHNFSPKQIFTCRELIEVMPKELVLKIGKGKWPVLRREVYNLFSTNQINIAKYPKISEAWDFEEFNPGSSA
jgi:hypothetical protein